jgi:molybdopterin converting factor small subunit
VTVRLFANLADLAPPGAGGMARIRLPGGTAVHELLERLGVPAGLPCLVLVNGDEADGGATLRAGDVVHVLPPLAGG